MKQCIIWWSSGDFCRISDERNTNEQVNKYFVIDAVNALEIMLYDAKSIGCSITKEGMGERISHYSIHTPTRHPYQNDEESHRILQVIEKICTELPIKNIVIHPDNVVDWSVFKQYNHLPFSIENMDDRKKSCRSVEDIKKILDDNPRFWLTLDLQHCFTNDSTMQLAREFHRVLWDKIVQYHLSWYHPDYLHYPLFKTQQNEIIASLENRDIPIIIESTFDEQDELQKEIDYIYKNRSFIW